MKKKSDDMIFNQKERIVAIRCLEQKNPFFDCRIGPRLGFLVLPTHFYKPLFFFGLFITIFLVPYHEKVIALSTAISCPNSGNAILEKLGSIAMTKSPSFHVKRLFTRTRTTTTITTKKFNNFASIMWREVF